MSLKPHLAMLPTPGMGHLISLVELSKKLVSLRSFTVTLILPTIGPPSESQKDILNSLPDSVSHILLPPVTFDDDTLMVETKLCLSITRSLPHIRNTLESLALRTKLVALIVDVFGTDLLDVAREFKVASYVGFWSNAMAFMSVINMPELDRTVDCEYRDMPEPIELPGCRVAVHGRDLPHPAQDRKNDAYNWLLHHAARQNLADGILLNTFMDMEPETISVLQGKGPPIYPIGPIIQSGLVTSNHQDLDCLKWLDHQPKNSVLFISFGSGGVLSSDQIRELAIGLELSRQKFLWVLRSPNNISVNASYFDSKSQTNPLNFLPQGFLDGTKKDQGLVVPSWAPQVQVLSHASTGGFLTHCGWNSILESVVHGVPLIAWPLYAKQKINSVLLSEDLKVALRPKFNENGIVSREEIGRVVRGLFVGEEGEGIRKRMVGIREMALKAVSEDGSSTKSLEELVFKWENC